MSIKKIDETNVLNELAGSRFFKQPAEEAPQPTSAQGVSASPRPNPQSEGVVVEKKTSLLANQQISKEASQQVSKPIKKFGSYLREDSIKALKRRAVEVGKKDYEVLQEALDLYLAAHPEK